ncbi:enhanced intracellular survival protein Eis [Kribbella sp. NPDC050241]|uniref:enhanced intracellular survival protein Eis n=1 Tax=Kribbella sp. NPDC050241 TaxID=3364115 RepID=UPI0037BAD022
MDALRVVDVSEADLDSVWEVRLRSFGPGGDKDEWRKDALRFIEDGRYIGVADGDVVVAAARIWPFQQWWGGRRVPMAGIAGVVVSPEYRGRGVGSMLMRGVLRRSVEMGCPLSGLYPATTVLYRHLGYEFAGGRYKFSFQSSDLRSLGGKGVTLRKAGREDAQLVIDLASKVHESRRSNGPLIWPLAQLESWLEDESNFAYVADDGFVVYNWSEQNLSVDELIAGSEGTTRALWTTVGSGASIARTVHAYTPPTDPINLMAEHEADSTANVSRWMLRLLDAPAAIAARGFAPGAVLEVDLRIDDPDVPANTGDWHLSVADGAGSLTSAQPSGDALRLGPRGLAALYAGTPLNALRSAGLATGQSTADLAIDTAFGGPTAYMLDFF